MKNLSELQLYYQIIRCLLPISSEIKASTRRLQIIKIIIKERGLTNQDLLDAYEADKVMKELLEEQNHPQEYQELIILEGQSAK